MIELTPLFLLAALVVLCGAVVQGSIGFGVGLVSAPVLAWTLPQALPATLIMLGGGMAVLTLVPEWRQVDGRGLLLALVGRVPGILLGTWLLVIATPQLLGVLIGVTVVAMSLLQGTRWAVPLSPPNLLAAGAISGATATVSGIGGPPLAMVYAGERGPVVRATLSAYFALGSALSLTALAFAGRVGAVHLVHALALVPSLVVGAMLARPLSRYLDSGHMRQAILLFAAASGLALVVTSLLG